MDKATKARPRITIHYAQSLDGRIATHSGHSQWVSGAESLRFAHQLRAAHEIVMVGVGTILADNPHLTVRLVPGQSPRRVIVDSTVRLPLDANVLTDRETDTIIATTRRATEERVDAARQLGAEVLVIDEDDTGRVDMNDLLHRLADFGTTSLLIEGGRGVITSALRGHLVDRLVVCIAPKIIGAGIEAVGDLSIHNLSEAITFSQTRFTHLGEDLIFEGYLNGYAKVAYRRNGY